MRPLFLALAFWAACVAALAQAPRIITTIAGTDYLFPDDGRAANAAGLGTVPGVAVDANGHLVFTDTENGIVARVDAQGLLRVLGGNSIREITGDGGPARHAGIREAGAIAVSADGDIFFVDSETVRRIAPDGTIRTVAGGGASRAEGIPATSAELVTPSGVAVAANGDLFISDLGRDRIFRVSSGILRTFAGGGATALFDPRGIALDQAGNLYVSEDLNDGGGRVRRISPDGTIASFAGEGLLTTDGSPALQFVLNRPEGLAVDHNGNVYITDVGQEAVFRVSGGVVRRFAGRETEGPVGDGGPALEAALAPYAVAADRSGNVYIAELNTRRVRRVDAAGIITTVAGSGVFRLKGDGGPAASATLNEPLRIVVDPAGNVYFNDYNNNRVRRISPSGIITTIAGGGTATGDGGPATQARLVSPFGLTRDTQGNIYIGEAGRIRRVAPDGVITTVAGGGDNRGENVPAREAVIDFAAGLAFDREGNLYFAEYQSHRIRRLGLDQRITTVAGTGEQGFSGDGGPATQARLSDPRGLAFDSDGNLYIAEYGGSRVRRVSATGRTITTFAGGGTETTDDGVATRAALGGPTALAFDAAGNLYVADPGASLIRRITPAGAISRFAGNGLFEFSGDGGPATSAALGGAAGVAIDAAGNVLIADTSSHRIRSVLSGTPVFQFAPTALTFAAQSGGALPPEQIVELSSNVPLPYTATVSTTSGGGWLEATPARGHLRAALRVTVNPANLAAGDYEGLITVTVPNASPAAGVIRVTARIVAPESARPVIEPAQLDFEMLAGDRPAVRHVRVTNAGGGAIPFAARATGPWLSVTPETGTASAAAPATLNVTADPAGLSAGTFRGEIVVSFQSPAAEIVVPVTLLVGRVPKSLLLSQTGLSFVAVPNGGAPPPHNVAVLNTGQGALPFTASVAEFGAPTGWLSVSPTAGETVAGSLQFPSLEVTVNATGLSAGDYFGQVVVTSAEADNSPQLISVVLSVLPEGSRPPPVIRPTGLVFIGEEGLSPGSQELTVSNLGSLPVSYISGRTPEPPDHLFQALPAQGTVPPGSPLRMVVQPDFRRLARGVRRGTLTLDFGDTFETVRVLLVVIPRSVASTTARTAHSDCGPTALQSEFTLLPKGFTAATGLPLPIEARVVDDCGHRLTEGAVTASFSNGDPPVALVHVGDGRWSGTWIPKTASLAPLLVRLTSISANNTLRGESLIDGSVRSGGNSPLVATGGIINVGASMRFAPVSPGALVEIYGAGLADSLVVGDSRPLATRLGSTEVFMQGRRLPLLFVSGGQVNAVVPYGVSVNTRLPLAIRRGGAATAIETITIAAAQPSVFPQAILGQDFAIVGTGRPARRGEAIVVFCAGLGAVNPPAQDGVTTPSEPLSHVIGEVSATIGGRPVQILFAGLTPGFVGLYQVNLLVPGDVLPSPTAPLILTVSGQSSQPVEIPVE